MNSLGRWRKSNAWQACASKYAPPINVCSAIWNIQKDLSNQLQDQTPQTLAIVRFQVDEFNAGSGWRNVADHGGGLDLAKSSANLQFHGVADRQPMIGFQECSAERKDANTCGPDVRSGNNGLHWWLHTRAKVPAGP